MDYIKRIDDIFSDYLQKRCNDNVLKEKLAINLSLLSGSVKKTSGGGYHFQIELISKADRFFGMCVYPSLECMETEISKLPEENCTAFNDSWSKMTDFVIEIDKNVFDRTVINFNPQELTALLLHELSHVVFTSKTSERIYYAYKRNYATIKRYPKNLLSKLMSVFYTVPGMIACSLHNWNIGKNGIVEEYVCDQVFGITEYQHHMASALNKIIEKFGNTIIESESTKDNKVERYVRWSNFNIKEMGKRRDKIKNDLFYESAINKSFSIRSAYLKICSKLGLALSDKYTSQLITLDSIIENIDEGKTEVKGILTDHNIVQDPTLSGAIESLTKMELPALEACKKNKTMKLPSEYDIDAISIEIDRIENHHDRIYVLDLIYNKIEQINNFRDYCEITEQLHKYDSKIKKMLTELEALRKAVLNKRDLNGGRYEVFVKYPRSYEG